MPTEPVWFESPAALAAWLAANSEREPEVLAGLYKGKGIPLTWPQLVDEVLKVGWIDGVRRTVDDQRWTIRLTPRRSGSKWSAKNLARMEELIAQGVVTPAGLAAWERRGESRIEDYSYETRRAPAELEPSEIAAFAASPAARRWFDAQPNWYRKKIIHWITAAKSAETRTRRLNKAIEASEQEIRQ